MLTPTARNGTHAGALRRIVGIFSTTFIRYGHTGEAWGVASKIIGGTVSLGGAVLFLDRSRIEPPASEIVA